MNRRLVKLFSTGLILTVSLQGIGQAEAHVRMTDSIIQGKYKLVFVSDQPDFDPVTRQRMIDAFFTVYPQEAERFNRRTLTRVEFFIDPTYTGVAETGNGIARYNPAWLKKNPEDIDVVTHEVMHIVQDYRGYNPGWLTEGIADYVRYVYGVNNLRSHWTLPDFQPGQSYTNAYRITARFLLWVEQHKNGDLVNKMDHALRSQTYRSDLWVKLTGKTVDELWAEYGRNPEINLKYK